LNEALSNREIKREEGKLEKQLGKLHHQLGGIRAAARASGHSAEHEVTTVKNASCPLLAERRLAGPRKAYIG